MKIPQLLLMLVVFCSNFVQLGATEKFKIGQLTKEEVKSAKCDYDETATAFYLYDYGETSITSDLKVKLRVKVQLKIVDKAALDLANYEIPYLNKTRVRKLKACTYNIVNGELEITKLKKEHIFRVDENDELSVKKLTFPNVREGSVIEYTYEVEYGNYYHLNTWWFQTSLPVLHSEYHVYVPNFFDYDRRLTGYFILDTTAVSVETGSWGREIVKNNHFFYLAKNLKAFKEEPLSYARTDLIGKLDFELRGVRVPGLKYERIMASNYKEFLEDLNKRYEWIQLRGKGSWALKSLIEICEGAKNDKEKVKRIFNHVKAFENLEEGGASLQKVFEAQKGTAIEKNACLVLLLREMGFDAYPLLLSTRSNGLIDAQFPIYSRLNFLIVYLEIGGKTYLLDASQPYHLFTILPLHAVNGKGVLIDWEVDEAKWIDLNAYQKSTDIIQAKLKLTEDELLVGNLKTRKKGYPAMRFKSILKEKGEASYKSDFEKGYTNWEIERHEIDQSSDFKLGEEIELEIEGQVESLGDQLFLNPVVYAILDKNPFDKDLRLYPVRLKYPQTQTYIAEIELPEGYKIERLPEPIYFTLGNEGAATFSYKISQLGNKVIVNQQFKIKETDYPAEDYKQLKEFYSLVIEKLKEKLVLIKE